MLDIISLGLALFIFVIAIYINYELGFIQKVKNWFLAIRYLRFYSRERGFSGKISPFQSFNIALSATVGIGNITGVSFAILLGGPGAVFWIWISAFLGMVLKFVSCFICFKYRIIRQGKIFGGMMYIYKNQLNSSWLGALTAFLILFTAFYTGNFIQSTEVMQGFLLSIPSVLMDHHFSVSFFFCLATFFVILNGVRYVGLICSIVAPFMISLYVLLCLWVIFFHIHELLPTLKNIFFYPFSLKSFTFGTASYLWIVAFKEGLLSGFFSNESAFGSSSFAHILAKSKTPFRQSMIAILEVVVDTLIICSLTAFVILMTHTWQDPSLSNPIEMMIASFNKGFFIIFGEYSSLFSSFLIGFILILFSYSTIIAWAYYGEQAIAYFFLNSTHLSWILILYRVSYSLVSFLGTLKLVSFPTFNNAFYLMSFLVMIPHLISLVILLPKVKNDLKK